MSGVNELRCDQSLRDHLGGKNDKPVPGSDSDINNGKSVEGGFRDYAPNSALVRAATMDMLNTLGIRID